MSLQALTAGTSANLQPGSLLQSRYIILNELGRGGFGAVYLAKDIHLGHKLCAIKEMNAVGSNTEAEKQQAAAGFRQEAQLLSALSHPNLPRVTDNFSNNQKHYLAMDYMEGQTLDRVIATRTQPFLEVQVLLWADQLCDVLHYLHTRPTPIIYRDLKPGNIILSPDQRAVRLIDFGIARFFDPKKTKDTVALGTPGYAAPEQYGAAQSDARSDVYTLGATLHHLLTLRDPGDDPFKFPSARSLNPLVSVTVDTALSKAVERLQNKRWRSAQEFKDALHGKAAGSALPQIVASTPLNPTVAAPLIVPQVITPPVQPQYPAPLPNPIPASYQPPIYYANNGARFGAYLIDSLILSLLSVAVYIPLVFFATLAASSSSSSSSGLAVFFTVICGLLIVAGWVGYYTYFHAKTGQTPGKKFTKIKVVRRDGSPLTTGRALWRTLAYLIFPSLVSFFCYIGWVFNILPLFDSERRCLHDFLADTRVINV